MFAWCGGVTIAVVCLFLLYAYVICNSLKMPVGLAVEQIRSKENMADTLNYHVSVAAPVDGDVVARELTVTVNGEQAPIKRFGGATVDLGAIAVPQGAQVVLSLVDIDDAGNESTPAVIEFEAVDTIAPSAPSAFSVTLVGETHDNTVTQITPADPETDETNG